MGMKSLPVVFVIFVVLFEIHNNLVVSEVAEKSCRAVLQDLTKLQLGLLSQCAKKMKFKNGKEKSKKQNCILRCAMVEAELLNKEGQVTPESIDYLLHKFLPPSIMDKANRTFYPCMEIGMNNPFKQVDEDPFCLDYDPFVKLADQCFMTRVGSVCD